MRTLSVLLLVFAILAPVSTSVSVFVPMNHDAALGTPNDSEEETFSDEQLASLDKIIDGYDASRKNTTMRKSELLVFLRGMGEKYHLEFVVEHEIAKAEDRLAKYQASREIHYKKLGELIEKAKKILFEGDWSKEELPVEISKLVVNESVEVKHAFKTFYDVLFFNHSAWNPILRYF